MVIDACDKQQTIMSKYKYKEVKKAYINPTESYVVWNKYVEVYVLTWKEISRADI